MAQHLAAIFALAKEDKDCICHSHSKHKNGKDGENHFNHTNIQIMIQVHQLSREMK